MLNHLPIVSELLKVLPKEIIITGDENTRPFECDALTAYRQKPLAVVLVENIDQIKTLLKVCKKTNTPIVPRGAATGLSGGATPLKRGIVLGVSKLNKIKNIDITNKLAIVEPGVRNIAISEAVSKHGLYYAPDPSSQIVCTIGGNVAENAGGVHCLKYGLTLHNVESLKMLTIDAEELELSRQDEGLGLLALMHGSEGLLGIITEIVVKLKKTPKLARVIMAGFASVDDCAHAVANIMKASIIPAGLEMMDKFTIKIVDNFAKSGYPLEVEALLLCELDGSIQEVKAELNETLKVLVTATTLKISNNEHERLLMWKGRKSAFPAMGKFANDYYCMDGTIPKRNLAKVLKQIGELSQKYNLPVANVFHAGDGNLHPLILYNAGNPGEFTRVEEFGTEIAKLNVDAGGTITGEHGVGIEKLNAMCHQFSKKELLIFHKIKKAFDENSLLNPGKAVPTSRRCVELGRLATPNFQI